RFDTRGFFDAPERRAALEAAAAQWSAVLDNDFLAVPAGVRLTLKNPENRDEDVVVASLEEQIDDLLVFVGTSEDIPGYGRGGPSSGAESTDATLDKSFSNRMNGKSFQPWAGSISFKGSIDYFFPAADSAERVPKDQYDFISLATHELGHVLGFTASPAFSALEDGATFTGKSAVAAYGRAVPLTEDLGHFEDGTESDGVEALMTPKLLNGIRQQPTRLDLAALHDIGYALK
ncbi:MAG: hemolysin-type calcium-binding protein, partial [Polyangiaceae bacterium]